MREYSGAEEGVCREIRGGDCADVGSAVRFLASDLSRWMTGEWQINIILETQRSHGHQFEVMS